MIKKKDVLKDVSGSVFKAITASCCVEFGEGFPRYYLHGDEETGDLYDYSGEHKPSNVLFTAVYRGEVPDDDMGGFDYETMENPDFTSVVEDLAEQWKSVYYK